MTFLRHNCSRVSTQQRPTTGTMATTKQQRCPHQWLLLILLLLLNLLLATTTIDAFSYCYPIHTSRSNRPRGRSQRRQWTTRPPPHQIEMQQVLNNKHRPSRRLWSATAASSSSTESTDNNAPRNRVSNMFMFLGQIAVLLSLYAFHLTVLTQHVAIVAGHFAIGYDSLVGASVAAWYFAIYRRQRQRNTTTSTSFPWKLPSAPPSTTTETNTTTTTTTDALSTNASSSSFNDWWQWIGDQSTNWNGEWIRFRVSTGITVVALIKAYFQTGRFSLFWEDLLFTMSAAGWPLTIPLSRSIQVLAGHLSWVAAGTALLWALPRPPPFFAQDKGGKYQWFRMSCSSGKQGEQRHNWLWWTIGGYFVSSWLFNMADAANHYILPAQVLHDAAESVVTQLVQPENNDVWASAIGYIAPCITAPVWEELLYRGFLLAGLTASTGSWHVSCFLQAVLFSAHHMSVTAALPLAVLGWTWAVLYTHSRSLWTVIGVHAMWNSRVFFGSWFGL
jgi:membrane protease YdiL (CAAX protease family)